MPVNHPIHQSLLDARVLPLFYHDDAETSFEVIKILYEEGIRVIEYTNRGINALSNFRLLRDQASKELAGMEIGIGTIHTESEAEQFLEAGARLLISPLIDGGIARAASDAGAFFIPGCMTPTEIQAACNVHAPLLKIFPANLLGPTYIRAIREIFPGIQFMPTGGVSLDEENINNWFQAGVSLVGMGSTLIDKTILRDRKWDILRERTKRLMGIINLLRENSSSGNL
jgi:2-dehydro-3-deoxyphosphogluconate aldolase / (4S)-4-hydroxy-2-oxoglutarate aldolase